MITLYLNHEIHTEPTPRLLDKPPRYKALIHPSTPVGTYDTEEQAVEAAISLIDELL